MHFTKVLAFAAILTTGAFALPAAEPNPPKPTPTKPTKPAQPTATVVNQQNQCGNNAQPYCCNTDNYGAYTTCKAMGISSQCSQTTVCCNANNSIQVCLGNAIITV